MSVAADSLSHAGPWTTADVEALPENGNRHEILTPGVLTVSPSPGTKHQRAARRLANVLEAAANAAGADVEVIEAINVRHPDERLTIPDIAVVDRAAAGKDPTYFAPEDLLLVVEIVSPGSKPADRAIKPDLYAESEIPWYWRLELDPKPCLHVQRLGGGSYEQVAACLGDTEHAIKGPFPCTFDPADLTRQAVR
ncbi:Uma2 family endonuclease [Sciscionella marina]|uniref:Uma2 family endonuclease n=1 Tax=Sciscionella marina TaxID=508770 RepID=UPI00036FA5AF|nr:Uma2 family endonuclease [Sciscionella marina]